MQTAANDSTMPHQHPFSDELVRKGCDAQDVGHVGVECSTHVGDSEPVRAHQDIPPAVRRKRSVS